MQAYFKSFDPDVWTVTDKGYEISDEHVVEFGKASSAKANNFCLNTLLRFFCSYQLQRYR
jgi:hypothetical protein